MEERKKKKTKHQIVATWMLVDIWIIHDELRFGLIEIKSFFIHVEQTDHSDMDVYVICARCVRNYCIFCDAHIQRVLSKSGEWTTERGTKKKKQKTKTKNLLFDPVDCVEFCHFDDEIVRCDT